MNKLLVSLFDDRYSAVNFCCFYRLDLVIILEAFKIDVITSDYSVDVLGTKTFS